MTSMQMDVDPPTVPVPPRVNVRRDHNMRASSEPLKPDPHTVGFVYSTEMMFHFSPSGHPETPERISRIHAALNDARCLAQMKRLPIRPVRKEESLLVHTEDHWDKVRDIASMTEQEIIDSESYYESMSLYVNEGTTRAARLSCGGVIEACLAVARGELQKTFAIVRPPGHHAEPDEHMGFCFFNNVAVATRVTQQQTNIKKIMILDWDVHHGNGTQRAFNDDPSVLYVSIHRYERGRFYPCGPFGSMESCGEGAGLGYSVNIPWPERGMGDADYIHAFQKVIMPIAMEFAPEMVIISAGFDAADGDDLGECHVTPTGYAHMTHMLSGLAGGKLVVALEGGYNLDSISKSALAVAKVILGEAPPELAPMVASDTATETIWQCAMEQSKYWKNLDPKACEPREDVAEMSFSIPEILKAHRQHYLYTQHQLLQIPLMSEELEQRFSTQVLCSSDILDNNTLIVLIHEFGNLRVELGSALTCDVEMEHSYLVDFSKALIQWIKGEGYALLDVNMFPKPLPAGNPRPKSKDELAKEIMIYLWDNYISLSDAQRVILVGHESGCVPLTQLLEQRSGAVQTYVKGVVQVIGHTRIPSVPKVSKFNEELRAWYYEHSLVILPTYHRLLLDEVKLTRGHGKIMKFDEPRPIKLLKMALPIIQKFIKEELSKSGGTSDADVSSA